MKNKLPDRKKIKMNTKYDEKFQKLEWFKRHPQFLPFIGDNYDKYKILQIGESHYISGKKEDDGFDIYYFRDRWWNDACENLVAQYGTCFNTRKVVEYCLNGGKSGAYNIFYNPLKSFGEVVLDEEIKQIDQNNKQLYHHFAFMNFYQMPSLHKGLKFWISLKNLAKDEGNSDLAKEIFRKCVEESIKVVDEVIDILDPNIIVFTSISARDAYKGVEYPELNGKYKDDKRVIYTQHPCCSHWYRSGKKSFEEKLKEIFHTL